MRFASLVCALAAFSCHTGSSNTLVGAAVMTSLALGSSAASRASGGCYAVCQQGESCNQKTGYCEPLPCRGLCRTDESCEEGFLGIKCVPGPALSVSSPTVEASTSPAPAKQKADAVRPPVSDAVKPPVSDAVKPPVPDAARPYMVEPVRIAARHDGFTLGGELFLPDGPPRACALIGSAMAVRARFYAPFARHLAAQGIAALTFDYRGIGASRPQASLKGFTAHFHDWGEKDLAGAADFLRARFPELPMHYVGHSAGGQLMGMIEGAFFSRALFIAAGTAYWKAYRGLPRAVMAALWWGVIPGLTALHGYLPMRRFGQGDDVPLGVAREWAQWGKDPRYVFAFAEPRGGLAYLRYSGPLRAVCFADDAYAPRAAMESLLALYPRAQKDLRLQSGPVGHFGFFKQPALWPEAAAFLAAS